MLENYSDDRGKGAGLWAERVAFKIRNCEFRNNWAFQGGGSIWLTEANATFFSNCHFFPMGLAELEAEELFGQ